MSDIKEVAELIAKQTKFPETKISQGEAEKFISFYIAIANKAKNYYSGTTESEKGKFLGNFFTRNIYLLCNNITDESQIKVRDYGLRDRIWITLSFLLEFYMAGKYTNVLKPYEIANQKKETSLVIIDKKENIEETNDHIEKKEIENKKGFSIFSIFKKPETGFSFQTIAISGLIGIALYKIFRGK